MGEAFIFNKKIYISNGYNREQKASRDLWVSTDGTDWSVVNKETPYDAYSEIVVFKGDIWAVRNSVWKSTDAHSWKLALQTTPFGRDNLGSSIIFANAIW